MEHSQTRQELVEDSPRNLIDDQDVRVERTQRGRDPAAADLDQVIHRDVQRPGEVTPVNALAHRRQRHAVNARRHGERRRFANARKQQDDRRLPPRAERSRDEKVTPDMAQALRVVRVEGDPGPTAGVPVQPVRQGHLLERCRVRLGGSEVSSDPEPFLAQFNQ